MSRIRDNYDNSWWRRFLRWVDDEKTEEEQRKTELFDDRLYEEEVDKKNPYGDRRPDPEKVAIIVEKKKETARLLRKYESWPETKGLKLFRRVYGVMAVVVCISIITVLLLTVSYLPEFGNPDNPINNEVTKRYIENGLEETGAVNIVSGMILDYRAFDTFGESHVLFIAACSVLILLRLEYGKDGKPTSAKQAAEADDRKYEPKNDVILQKIAMVLVPPIILFGIYVILNGHLSPGGGFSGGAIIGAGLILYLNAYGFQKTERFITSKTYSVITVSALVFYALSKSYSFFTGANHLESGIPLGTPGAILSSGLILPLNICVGLVVACTMYGFYAIFRKGGL